MSIELDRGVTVHKFALPPAGFDPLRASARELRATDSLRVRKIRACRAGGKPR